MIVDVVTTRLEVEVEIAMQEVLAQRREILLVVDDQGRLIGIADRFDRLQTIAQGSMLTAALAALTFALNAGNLAVLTAIFGLAGLYVIVQEALEASDTGGMAGAATLGMSYGALGTVNGTAKFISSTAVGLLWTLVSPVFSFGLAALLMAAGTVALARVRGDGGTQRTR